MERAVPAGRTACLALELDRRVGYDARVMRWLIRLVMVCAVLLAATSLPAADGETDAALARAHGALVERTREYRASLERLLALQEATAARAADTAAQRRRLHERGFVSRVELEESERHAASAEDQIGDTRRRMAQTDALLAEALAATELARAPAATTTGVTEPAVIGSRDGADLTSASVHDLGRFFASRFARSLPVSAVGQTPVHDRLGFDHRHALDVAVHPDSEEGRAVIEYCQHHRIPFLAFRGIIPGASTGAHVHIGRASARMVPVSAMPR